MKKAKKYVMDIESASAEFESWCEVMDVETDPIFMDEDDLKGFNDLKNKFVRGLMKGYLRISSEKETSGYVIFKAKGKGCEDFPEMTFHKRSGADLEQQDKIKQGHRQIAKNYATIASMCRTDANYIYKLEGDDIKIVEGIFALLVD